MPVAINCCLVFAAIDEFAGVTKIDTREPLDLDVDVHDEPCPPHPDSVILRVMIKKIESACFILVLVFTKFISQKPVTNSLGLRLVENSQKAKVGSFTGHYV